jgi:hypothetical protein
VTVPGSTLRIDTETRHTTHERVSGDAAQRAMALPGPEADRAAGRLRRRDRPLLGVVAAASHRWCAASRAVIEALGIVSHP